MIEDSQEISSPSINNKNRSKTQISEKAKDLNKNETLIAKKTFFKESDNKHYDFNLTLDENALTYEDMERIYPKMYIIKGEKKEEKRIKTQTNSVIQNNNKNKIINNFNRSKINSTIQDDYKVELTDIPKRNNEINFKNDQNDIINIYKISIRNMNNKKILLKPYNNHKFNSNNDNPKNT